MLPTHHLFGPAVNAPRSSRRRRASSGRAAPAGSTAYAAAPRRSAGPCTGACVRTHGSCVTGHVSRCVRTHGSGLLSTTTEWRRAGRRTVIQGLVISLVRQQVTLDTHCDSATKEMARKWHWPGVASSLCCGRCTLDPVPDWRDKG